MGEGVYTSYFANVKNLPDNLYPIAISLYPPRGWSYPVYKRLAPTAGILRAYKETQDEVDYIVNFDEIILSRLNAESVMREIMRLCPEGKMPCLVCYEKPTDFCHRHLVAKWLKDNGHKVREYGVYTYEQER